MKEFDKQLKKFNIKELAALSFGNLEGEKDEKLGEETSNQWENPGNWSCGTVPDLFTDVVIGSGATVVINSNVSIATLSINPGASFTVNSPFTLTLLGH